MDTVDELIEAKWLLRNEPDDQVLWDQLWHWIARWSADGRLPPVIVNDLRNVIQPLESRVEMCKPSPTQEQEVLMRKARVRAYDVLDRQQTFRADADPISRTWKETWFLWRVLAASGLDGVRRTCQALTGTRGLHQHLLGHRVG